MTRCARCLLPLLVAALLLGCTSMPERTPVPDGLYVKVEPGMMVFSREETEKLREFIRALVDRVRALEARLAGGDT